MLTSTLSTSLNLTTNLLLAEETSSENDEYRWDDHEEMERIVGESIPEEAMSRSNVPSVLFEDTGTKNLNVSPWRQSYEPRPPESSKNGLWQKWRG